MLKRRRFDSNSELEARLHGLKAEPRDEFVDGLVATVEANPLPRRTWSRLAFASAVAVFILGTFASFGGLGYAASGASGTYHVAKKVATGKVLDVHKTSARDQYSPTGTHKPKPHQTQVTGVAGAQQGLQPVKSSGTLPFTGLSLFSTLVLSLALIASGILLRRRERRQS